MAKTTVEIPERKMAELEAYKDRLGELLLLGLSQVKIQEALLQKQRGLISIGRAAELARFNRAGNGCISVLSGWHPARMEYDGASAGEVKGLLEQELRLKDIESRLKRLRA